MTKSASASDVPVLAGDIGGTHARFALARAQGAGVALVHQRIVPVRAHADPASALADFLRDAPAPAPRTGCLAWAGPIDGARARLTNGAWSIDAAAVAARCGLDRLALVNDFHGAAAGIDALAPADLVPLHEAAPDPAGARLVIGAGTGLGVAYALRDDRGTRVVAGEGGHVAFAPLDEAQVALLVHAQRALGRVTAEHLVSGSGIVRLYGYCCARDAAEVPDDVHRDGAAAVSRRADAGEARARDALALFCAIFGAVAGDHALACLATGGVYVAGGIATRLAARMADGRFRAAFLAKGVHADLVRRMPVWLVRDELLGVKGAALLALR